MTQNEQEPDITDDELQEDGDDSAEYHPGHPDDDGQDSEETERPDSDKHADEDEEES